MHQTMALNSMIFNDTLKKGEITILAKDFFAGKTFLTK